MVRRGTRLLLYLLLVYLVLGLCLGSAWRLFIPPSEIFVLNYRNESCSITLCGTNGCDTVLVAPHSAIHVEYASREVRVVCGDIRFEVILEHRHRAYIIIPPFNCNSVDVLRAYSVFDEWYNAPRGLCFMTGLLGCYVEEESAGRLFNICYYEAYERLGKVLEKVGITGADAVEIAATAMWACQLVREVETAPFDITASLAALHHIGLELGLPGLEYWGSPLLLFVAEAVKLLPRDFLLKEVLYGVKSVDWYIAMFPSWRRVDERLWLHLCREACSLTLEPVVPSYAPVLLAGVLVLHAMRYLPLVLLAGAAAVMVLRRRASGR